MCLAVFLELEWLVGPLTEMQMNLTSLFSIHASWKKWHNSWKYRNDVSVTCKLFIIYVV